MSVLSASGAGVRHHRRWLLRDLDLTAGRGEIVAVTGPPGSGRTSTVLALAGKLRLSAGKVALGGTSALAHVTGVNDPEPVFTVREHVAERLALLGRPRREAAAVDLHGLDPGLRGSDLTPYQKQVLGLILARLAKPALIALDGVDSGLDEQEQAALWALIGEVIAEGVTVLVTARAVDPGRVSRVVLLDDPQSGEPGHARVQESPPPVDGPVEEAPANDEPVEEAPVEEAPVEEAPVGETRTEEAPAEGEPADKAPIGEAPVEDIEERGKK
ncbi:ATP-binding cassette domain-containing protein [Actinoplanes sp. NPDC020271]|uniref:ABC transporter ATP-binding protein n=1 Tax=Actinoplanes sp. NPDC020271 TaxID=3363896 RepID=UPI00378A380D